MRIRGASWGFTREMPRELPLGPNTKLASLCARRTFWTPEDDLNINLTNAVESEYYRERALPCRSG